MRNSILSVLIYADIFDYPLTVKQLHRRKHVKKKDALKNTEKAVKQLVSSRKVEKQGEYYFLPGRKKIVQLRQEREKYTRKKIKIGQKIANLIKLIPTVKFIGLTGSVAAGNAKKEDDIDFFIITSSGWLWTTRLLATLLTAITGQRRRPGDQDVKDKICLNLFIEQSNLKVFDHNLFIAYELAQLRPLINKNNAYQKLLAANQWLNDYLPNNQFKNLDFYPSTNFNYSSGSENIVEKIFYQIQLWWMKKRKTSEVAEIGLIAFHPNDISQEVMVKYKSRVSKL